MSDFQMKWIGVLVAVLLHVIVALCITSQMIFDALFSQKKKTSVTHVEVEKNTPVIRIVITPNQPAPAPQPKPSSQYVQTTQQQPQEKPKEVQFFGATDTVAQSTAAVEENAPNKPSIAGEKKEYLSTSESTYQDGKLEHENAGAATIQPSPPSSTTKNEQQSKEPKTTQDSENKKEVSAQNTTKASNQPPPIEYLDAKKKLPTVLVKNEDQQQVSEKVSQARTQRKPRRAAPRTIKLNDPGFRSERKATKVVGSISRRGKVSSVDVKGTPLGKYMKTVQNEIAKEWYRRTGQKSDLIKPGTITVTYLVYDTKRIKIVDLRVYEGSEIQTGITLQAITSAKIPTIPATLKKELNGDPVEMSTVFNFLN